MCDTTVKMCKKTYTFVLIVFGLILSGNSLPFFLQKTEMFNQSKVCDDFYQYVCKEWASKTTRPPHEPVWNHWQEVSHKINERLQKILAETNESDPALRKAQIFYKTCINADKFNKKHLRQLRKLVEYLIDENASENYQWIVTLMKVTKILNIHPIIKVYSAPDFKNTTKKMLYIERGNLILPNIILSNPKEHVQQIKAYREWITETIGEVYGKTLNQINVVKVVTKMIEFEINLAKISLIKHTKKRVTVKELMKLTPVNWLSVLKSLPVNGGVNLNTLITADLNYLQKLLALTKKTNRKQIVNYITWSVIKDLSRETTSNLRHLNFIIDKTILGVDSDIPRQQECTNHIINYMSYALINPYVNRHLHEGTLSYVKNISHEIKGEFAKVLKKNTWMGEHTKTKALEKVGAIKYLIGHPEWATNGNFVNKYYENVNITENHFVNMIELKRFASKNVWQNEKLWLPLSPFEVNAYYSILQNMIIIPLGLLEKPFFDVKRPACVNYGAIGSLIGHEISHSLDNIGRNSDKTGNIVNWWSKLDVFKFNARTQCFDHKTKDFLLLAETIADDVGLKLSLSAYKNLKPAERDKSLVQTFFSSYAQLWCELSTQSQFLNDDEHSPVKTRVMKSLHNNRDFGEVFNCTQKKIVCQLW